MKAIAPVILVSVLACVCNAAEDDKGWINLFDGKTLDGWKTSEDERSFHVKDGMIVAHAKSPRSHLFYVGPVNKGVFKNFEFKAEVMTTPGSNSGIYFHTEFQQTGFPNVGHEVQANNTHKNKTRTGSLFAVKNITTTAVKDNEWFTEHIIVRGKRVVIKVNGKTTVDYTEPEGFQHATYSGRRISQGTFALQAHDPNSVAYFRNIRVKPLPD